MSYLEVSFRAADFVYRFYPYSKLKDLSTVTGLSVKVIRSLVSSYSIDKDLVSHNQAKLHFKQLKIAYENNLDDPVYNVDFRVRKKNSRLGLKKYELEISYIIDNHAFRSYEEIGSNLGITKEAARSSVYRYSRRSGGFVTIEDSLFSFALSKCSRLYHISRYELYNAVKNNEIEATVLTRRCSKGTYLSLTSLDLYVRSKYPDRIFYCFTCDKTHLKGKILCE